MFSVGAHPNRVRALIGAAAGMAATVGFTAISGSSRNVNEVLVGAVALRPRCRGWLGSAGPTIAPTRRQSVRLRRCDDRARRPRPRSSQPSASVSRELHDIVAHALDVMVVQASAERLAPSFDCGDSVKAMAALEETGRGPLAELRRLLGVV